MQHLIRDPVHRTISLSSYERTVIDHPLFQRLRRIKQTAFLDLIFPGATHTRLSHSIGVMHIAGQAFDHIAEDFSETFGPRALQPNQKDFFRRLLRMATLLHDVGHGPFSHSLEGVTNAGRPIHPLRHRLIDEGSIPNHWILPRSQATKKAWLQSPSHHEEFSVALISRMADEDGQLGGVAAQDIASLLVDWVDSTSEFRAMDKVGPSGKWSLKAALKSLVSGELDADRMDYLLRDSHYTGVPYGQYDKEMLIENIIWRPDPSNPKNLCVCLRRKALHAFEDFLISRFHMFMQLYSHKTTVGFDVVLENALAELPDFHIEPDLVDYVTWSDDWLLRKILENRSSRWGAHIRDRIPLKHLLTVRQENQKAFKKFMDPYELSAGTTAWFPSLKNKLHKKPSQEIPKLWWRHSAPYLTQQERGNYPLYLEDRKKLIPVEEVSLLLKSDYTRRFEMIHVYGLRDEEKKVVSWFLNMGVPESILPRPKSLLP